MGHSKSVEDIPPSGRISLSALGSRDRLSPKRGIAENKVARSKIKSLMHKGELVMRIV